MNFTMKYEPPLFPVEFCMKFTKDTFIFNAGNFTVKVKQPSFLMEIIF